MNNKYTKNNATTIRINSEIFDTIKVYSEAEGITQTDFINNLLSDALSEYFLKRSGGSVMNIPNPNFFDKDLDECRKALDILADTTNSIPDGSIKPLLYNLLAFYNQRLFYELPEDKEIYERNRKIDGR